MKWIKILSLILVCPLIVGALYQTIAAWLDSYRFPPPGKLVDVGGYRLHLYESGSGNIPVILDAGLGLNSLEWCLVQPAVAEFARVCSFDRAGYGWSDRGPLPRTSLQMIHELHMLLEKAELPKPYILVGHSLGGINVQLYAHHYPDEVAGLILVDSSHEDQIDRLPPDPESIQKQNQFFSSPLMPILSYLGINRLVSHMSSSQKVMREAMKAFPASVQDHYIAMIHTNKLARMLRSEHSHFPESLQLLKQCKGTFGDKPLIVITAGKMEQNPLSPVPQEWLDATYREWDLLQKELAAKSTWGKQIIAVDSSHTVTRDKPQIIVDAIREVLTSLQ
jgi:pimeloyl-ACP methyl ester carboxylesterase